MATGEFEIARSFFITHPGEELNARLRVLNPRTNEIDEDQYPVIIAPPETAGDALIPRDGITIREVGTNRKPIDISFKEAYLLKDETGEVCGLQVGVLTIRKRP